MKALNLNVLSICSNVPKGRTWCPACRLTIATDFEFPEAELNKKQPINWLNRSIHRKWLIAHFNTQTDAHLHWQCGRFCIETTFASNWCRIGWCRSCATVEIRIETKVQHILAATVAACWPWPTLDFDWWFASAWHRLHFEELGRECWSDNHFGAVGEETNLFLG